MSDGGVGLRAFVAMRIGQRETDTLFRTALSPALRACGVTPIRIDKVEHNDDIDERILTEIARADVVIADLTFARPSAYFEAGYAAGLAKPVIYTARSDHFRDKDDDPVGNLRVHFDPQMKNIISWSDPTSAQFRRRLEARIRLVLRPIVRRRESDKVAAEARVAFAALSLARRLTDVLETVEAHLKARGYKTVRLGSAESFAYSILDAIPAANTTR